MAIDWGHVVSIGLGSAGTYLVQSVFRMLRRTSPRHEVLLNGEKERVLRTLDRLSIDVRELVRRDEERTYAIQDAVRRLDRIEARTRHLPPPRPA